MLTAIQARNAKAKEKPYKLTDGKGLFLHVATSGKKTWRYRFELPPGTESGIVLGEYPVMSLENARIERAAARELVKAGINPADARRQEKQATIGAREAVKKVVENKFETITLDCGIGTKKTDGHRATLTQLSKALRGTFLDRLGAPPLMKLLRRWCWR
jgi:hypothetical protein